MIKQHFKKELIINGLLKPGSKGNDVKKVQEWLNLYRYISPKWNYIVTIDGDFGLQTSYAIKDFQRINNLETDGIVGMKTFSILSQPLKSAFKIIIPSNIRNLIIYYSNRHLINRPRELKNNTGPWVRAYMDGNEGKQWAWCMGFVQTILDQAFSTLNQKFTSFLPHTFSCDVVGEYGLKNNCLIRNSEISDALEIIKPGDLFLISKSTHDWVHTGIITDIKDDWIYTVEGNTNDEGVREGFEVCRRMRNFKKNNIDIFHLKI